MAVAKKKKTTRKSPALKKPTSKKVVKKVVSKKKPTQKNTAKLKKKTTTRKRTSKKKTLLKKRITVKIEDGKAPVKIKIHNRSIKQKNLEVKQIFDPSELKLVKHSGFKGVFANEHILQKVARTSGVFIVVTGAILAMVNLQSAVGSESGLDLPQSANIIEGGDGTTPPIDTQNPRPEPRITVDSNDSLSNTVEVMITVPYAGEVDVLAKALDISQILPIDSAQRLDESTWILSWDTRQFEDGEYKIGVVIHNEFGGYDYLDSTHYFIDNSSNEIANTGEAGGEEEGGTEESVADDTEEVTETDGPGDEVADAASSSGAEEVSNPTDPDEEVVDQEGSDSEEVSDPEIIEETETPHIDIEVPNGEYLTEIAQLKAIAPIAEKVKLYVRNKDTLNLHFLGYMKKLSDSEWGFAFDTETVVDDLYWVYAKALFGDNYINSDKHSISIKNSHLDDVEVGDSEEVLHEEQGTEQESGNDESQKNLIPEIETKILKENPVSDFVTIISQTTPVNMVEFFVIPQNSLILKFLGLGKETVENTWKFIWDTKLVPNGEYEVYSRVRSEYGFTEGERKHVTVKNAILSEFTEEQEKHIDKIINAESSITKIVEDVEDKNDGVYSEDSLYIKPIDIFISSIDIDELEIEDVENALQSHRLALSFLLNELALATRNSDNQQIEAVKGKIENLKNKIILDLISDLEKKEILDQINAYVSQVTFELEEVTIQNEIILRNRIGEELLKDSDNDSISDYDEIHLYKTNPFVADSDGDGFIDSAEIKNGFNPNDSSSEALILYESPKETGIVREDLLTVGSITALSQTEDTQGDAPTKALITGQGLPNSFVTIYIFSEPVIITVKTDSDGSWRYVFDKELEDGQHEIYVGITDNAGKIVGKSEPVSFIKTAEAYTITPAQEEALITPEDSVATLIGNKALLLIASLAVISLGLILILLGLHVSGRRENPVPKTV